MKPSLELGERVRHRAMGYGTVAGVAQGRRKDEVWIAYDSGGEGRYDPRWFELMPDEMVRVFSREDESEARRVAIAALQSILMSARDHMLGHPKEEIIAIATRALADLGALDNFSPQESGSKDYT